MKKVLIAVGIIVGILLVISLGTMYQSNNKSLLSEMDKLANQQSSQQTNNTTKKDYYDFIDTNYYTFNYTEDELIKIICDGRNYTGGYKKSASTKDKNTSLYTAMTSRAGFSGIEIISITTDINNYKVKEFSFSFSSNNNLTQDGSTTLLNTYLGNGFSCLLLRKPDKNTNDEDMNKITEFLEGIDNSEEKGLKYYTTTDLKTVTATFTATK